MRWESACWTWRGQPHFGSTLDMRAERTADLRRSAARTERRRACATRTAEGIEIGPGQSNSCSREFLRLGAYSQAWSPQRHSNPRSHICLRELDKEKISARTL